MTRPQVYIKAILATLIAVLGALGTALTDGAVSAAEVVGILSSGIVALGVVYTVPNSGTPGAEPGLTVLPEDGP